MHLTDLDEIENASGSNLVLTGETARAGNSSILSRIRSVVSITRLSGLLLALLSGLALFNASAGRSVSLPSTAFHGLTAAETTLLDDDSGSEVVGEFEGYFDVVTRRITIRQKAARAGRDVSGGGISSRFNPGSEVAQGQVFGFSVINSAFINAGENPATVNGEVQISNLTSTPLLNTRIVFTAFRLGNAGGADAGNLPVGTGLAYFNDGQIANNGKLHISRYYGDIPANGAVKKIWTFAVPDTPPGFFFAYKVLADRGVAAESVQPAAVQVNGASGTSVLIKGRGFSGTPAVELLDAGGSTVGTLTGVSATATQVNATVPAGTAPGLYNLRVTNPGGTPGGNLSTTLSQRLTVTAPPDGAHTLSGTISSLNNTGPFLISGSATISSSVTVLPGTVIYFTSGSSLNIASGGNLIADGGIPGIPGSANGGANPAQIVFTAQRGPGASLPVPGFWGGVIASSSSVAEMVMKNVVVEYGGQTGSAQIVITGSGRKLRFTDSISRNSAGAGLAAGGTNDSVSGFTRNLIEGNGSSSSDPAMLLSGNAALGLYDLNSGTGGTSVGDPGFYYSSANDFNDNIVNAIQIGTDNDAASNDFTKSGVLVGQGDIPLRIRGTSANPAIIGAAPPSLPAELTINPAARIQIAAGTDLKAGDYPSDRIGCIAANGYAGFYLGTQGAMSNQYIEFDKIPTQGNFGTLFFSRNAIDSCFLNYVRVQNGGASSLGNAEVIVERLVMKITNSQINNSSTGGLYELLGASVSAKGTTFNGNTAIIDTIAGGVLGNHNIGVDANLINPAAVAIDPLGRGIIIVDSPSGVSYIRFVNTGRSDVTIAGIKVPGGAIINLAGGGLDFGENVPGADADLGIVTGIAVSPNGNLLYFIDSGFALIRAINISNVPQVIAGVSIASGNVGSFAAQGFGSTLNGLAVNQTNGDLYVADATAGANKIFKIQANVSDAFTDPTTVAGNGATTKNDDAFSGGAATGIPLLQPRAIVLDAAGNVYVADTGHARVIKVDTSGIATLIAQFPPKADGGGNPYTNNPFTSGLALFNNKVYIANGNTQDIARIDTAGNPPSLTLIAGTIGAACDYSLNNCGDGGPASGAGFSMLGSTGTPPLASIGADANGLYVLDQGSVLRGRVRYINLSAGITEVAGIKINPGNIETIAGTGSQSPFDGGLATSAAFNSPVGVAVDPSGNLWISDTLSSKLRFVNRGGAAITIFAGTAAEQTVQPGSIVTINKDVGAGSTDGVTANLAGFDTPQGIWATAEGVFIADSKKGPGLQQPASRRTSLIRFINTTSSTVTFYPSGFVPIMIEPGFVQTIAGGSTDTNLNNPGDGADPLNAKFLAASDIIVHPTTGDIYIADPGNRRVRRITRSNGTVSSFNLPSVSPNEYTGISFDSTNRLLVADPGQKQILREKTPGSGFNANGFDTIMTGDPLNRPRDVVEAADGSLYVTSAGDTNPFTADDHKIIRITLNGSVGSGAIFLGSKTPGYKGDGGPAANARISITPQPVNIATVGNAVTVRTTVNIIRGVSGEIIFTDSGNNAVRRIR